MDDEEEKTQEVTPEPEPEAEPEPEPEVTPEPEPEALAEPTGMLNIFPDEDTSLSNLPIFPE